MAMWASGPSEAEPENPAAVFARPRFAPPCGEEDRRPEKYAGDEEGSEQRVAVTAVMKQVAERTNRDPTPKEVEIGKVVGHHGNDVGSAPK